MKNNASPNKPKVPLVEDSAPLARVYLEYLKDEFIDITHVDTGEAAKERKFNNSYI